MLPKKFVVVIALAVLALLCPAAYAGGGEANESANDRSAVQAQDEKQKPNAPIELFPTAAREAGPKFLWARAGTTHPASGLATSAAASTGSTDDKWEVLFAPYLFLGSVNGTIGVGRVSAAPIDVRAGSVLKALQFGGMGHFEVRKGHWGGIFEASYVKLGDSITTVSGGFIPVERVTDAEFEQTMLEAFLSYRLGTDKTKVYVFGGARYWDMDIDLQVTGPLGTSAFTRGDRWADPVVGVQVIHFLSDKWFVPARGDVGGFGRVGATSAFTWNIQGGIGYQLNKHFATVVQYKALGDDFDNGKGGTPDFFRYDAIQHGPLLGLVLKF